MRITESAFSDASTFCALYIYLMITDSIIIISVPLLAPEHYIINYRRRMPDWRQMPAHNIHYSGSRQQWLARRTAGGSHGSSPGGLRVRAQLGGNSGSPGSLRRVALGPYPFLVGLPPPELVTMLGLNQ